VILVPASNNVLQYVSINQRECQAIYMQIYRAKKEMMKGGNYMVSLNSFPMIININVGWLIECIWVDVKQKLLF
jgi:hypothetical protein